MDRATINTHLTRRKRPRSRRTRWILVICLALLLCGLGGMAIALGRLGLAARAVEADLRALERLAAASQKPGDLQERDIQEAVALLRTTRADLEDLQRAARPFLWLTPYLGWVPRYGTDIQAAPLLLDIALHLVSAGEKGIEPLLPVLQETLDHQDLEQSELLQRGLATLNSARPEFMDALSHIQVAEAARQRLEAENLSPLLHRWMPRLDQALKGMGLGMRASLVLPELVGADGPRTWLVLVQNEDELRATGGFISGVARMTVDQGRIVYLDFEDSYAVDDWTNPYPDPPEPLLTYMLSDLWVFRDSNWSPDFPTSAQAAIDLYTISRDAGIDGVIALDQRAIQLLIRALGPLALEGYPEPITGDNVIQIARQSWSLGMESGGDWWTHRKDFMATVFQATARRLEDGLDRAAIVPLIEAILQALDEKHILVYVEDENAAMRVSELGWDGALQDSPGDYLMVVDTNMGFNKANALVEQHLEYVVDLTEPDRPSATLTVRHHHPLEQAPAPCRHEPRYGETYEQMAERCYWDYLRVYVPSASMLVDATPHSVPASELLSGQPSPAQVKVGPPEHGRNVFATFLLPRPSETVETVLTYTLPGEVVQVQGQELAYRLLIQKQPGTRAVPVRVQILLPQGVALKGSEPEPALETPSRLEYALRLDTDQRLWITFGAATAGTSASRTEPGD